MSEVNRVGIQLVCGLPATINDTASAENGPFWDGQFIIDLLSWGGGFQVNAEDWIPQIAAPTPRPSADGQILGYETPDVKETINVAVISSTTASVNAKMKKLHLFQGLVREFWAGSSIEPVYIEWKAAGAPGPQYALIRNMQVAQEISGVEGAIMGDIVITIDRAPVWRPIPPGANPLLWTYEAAGTLASKTYTDFSLYSPPATSIGYSTVENGKEHNGLDTFTSANWIQIAGSSIPGDAPAQVCVTMADIASGTFSQQRYIGLRSGSTSVKNRSGNAVPQFYSLAGVDGCSLGTGVTRQNLTSGLRGYASPSTAQVARCAFPWTDLPLGTSNYRVRWNNNSTYLRTSAAMWRGTFAVFLRAGVVSGAYQPVVYLRYGTSSNKLETEHFDMNVVYPSATAQWGVTPMGTITLPVTREKALVSADGRGLSSPVAGTMDVEFDLCFETHASTFNVDVLDLVFIPIDEGAVRLGIKHPTTSIYTGSPATNVTIYDNTGYFNRGKEEHIAISNTNATTPISVPVFGQPIYLQPGMTNRLYFLYTGLGTLSDPEQSQQVESFTAAVNIVPGWYGRRDV